MSFKSSLATMLLLIGTQSFAATYHCALDPKFERTEHHSYILIETSKESVKVVTQDSRFEVIDQKFLKISTPDSTEITTFSGWIDNKLVNVVLPTYVLEKTVDDLFKMDLDLHSMADETSVVSASYYCTKKYF